MLRVRENIRALFLLFISAPIFAQFTPGNIVVLQAGNGTTALVNTGNQVILKEYSSAGVVTFSVAVSTSVNPLIISGTAVSEGGLSLSPNGKYLVFAGYASNLTFTASLGGATASALNRGVGIVNAAGNYSRIATSPTFYSGNSIRSSASDGSHNYWASGANAGANYFGINSPAATIQTSITNTRNVIAFNGNLYFSTGSGTPGIYRVGSGFPFVGGQTCSLVIGTSGSSSMSPSPYAFFFNQGQTICYIADDRTAANNGGIQKWLYNANAWTLAYTLATGTSYGARGVVADFSGPNPKIYATTSEGSLNRLIAINDLGAGSTATNLAIASANTIFRGLAFSPFCSAPQAGTISTNGTVCANQSFTLSANSLGSPPLSYVWSGPGSFSSSAQSPVISTSLSGNYSVNVTNGCGSDGSVAPVTVNLLPPVSVNGSTICVGGTAVLTASGASTYTWSNAVIGSSVALSPAVTTNYTVTGSSLQGCSALGGASVVVVNVLNILVNSAALCRGDTVILSASGATSYTWNTNSNSYTISVNPLVTSNYTVTGFASGCASPVSAVSTVTVHQTPVVSIQLPGSSFCVDDAPVTLTGNPPGGVYTGTAVTANLFNPSISMAGNFLLTYSFTDNNNCSGSDSAMILVNTCDGLGEIQNPGRALVFPNPAKDFLTLDLKDLTRETTIQICNEYGQKITEQRTLESPFVLDVRDHSKGIYLLLVKWGLSRQVLIFIKE